MYRHIVYACIRTVYKNWCFNMSSDGNHAENVRERMLLKACMRKTHRLKCFLYSLVLASSRGIREDVILILQGINCNG